MAVTFMASFESRHISLEGDESATVTGGGAGAGISQLQARTGTSSFRFNMASGVNGNLSWINNPALTYLHFGLYVATLPSSERAVAGVNGAAAHIGLQADGTLAVYNAAGTQIGLSTTKLSTGRWYWIGSHWGSFTGACLQIDGLTEVSGTQTGTAGTLGPNDNIAAAIDFYIDDLIVDGAAFLASSKVGLLVPTADSAVGTGWTLGTGTAISGNSGSTAVKNEPPLGVADLAAGSDVKQIRNASANANVNYDATMTTYSAAGLGGADTVLAVQPVISTAAPVTTSSKQGTVGVVSNPAITNIALGAGGTAGAFWSGVAGGTHPTGWKASFGTLTTSPSVTLGTAPVMRVTQVTSSTRIAVVCFMGMQVAWTPAAVRVPYNNPMIQLLPQ